MVTERGRTEERSDSKGKRPLQDVAGEQPASRARSTAMGQERGDMGHLPRRDGRVDVPETPGNGASGNIDSGSANDDMEEAVGETPGLDSVRELRLIALLRDLVAAGSQAQAADELGVDRKTLWRSMNSGRLAPVVATALERKLLEDARAELAGRAERLAALEQLGAALDQRVGALEQALGTGLEAVRRELAVLRESPVPAERPGGERTSQKRSGAAREQRTDSGAPAKPPWRPYPQLVTSEPEPGEELVYGEATANVAAWREARRQSREGRRRLERLDAELRMRELELVLIGDHELTLPPAVYPWDRADRRSELWRRRQALVDVRVERRRALVRRWVRRLLTLGLWRK